MRARLGCRASSRVALAVSLVLVVVGVIACGPSPSSASAPATSDAAASGSVAVTIRNFAFTPESVTVHAGTTVTWTQEDPQPTNHTATADRGAFNTGLLASGRSGSFQFATPGRFAYHCAVHNYMTGVIVVVP